MTGLFLCAFANGQYNCTSFSLILLFRQYTEVRLCAFTCPLYHVQLEHAASNRSKCKFTGLSYFLIRCVGLNNYIVMEVSGSD